MNADANTDFAEVIAAEQSLLAGALRNDRASLERILAAEFTEIGGSGRLWTRDEVITALTAEDLVQDVRGSDFSARHIEPNLVLLFFVTTVGDASARRSSLWRKTEDGIWQILFHQGTVVCDTPTP